MPKWLAILPVCVADRVVALLRRAEGALDRWVVVEQGEENRDAFNDGCAEFRFDPHPVVAEPTTDGGELLALGFVENEFLP